MNRTATAAAVAVLVVLSVAAPAFGMPVSSAGESPRWAQTTTASTGTNETSPGARLGGAVAAQGVAVGTEVESRSLRHQLNQSNSNDSKAAVLARQVNRSQSRLAALRTDRRQLETAYRNDSISESEYRIRATRLSAQISAVRRLNAQTSGVADRLPAESLRRNGVNVTALRSLRSMADEVEGPQIAAIAREIAGPQNGLGPSRAGEQRGANRGASGQRGPSDGERGPDGRPGAGPPNDEQGQTTANESTDAGGTDDDPTPRGTENGGPTNSSADERGQGGGDGNPGNGEPGEGNGEPSGGNSEPGEGNGGPSGGSGEPGEGNGDPDDGNAGRAEGQ